MLSQLPEHEPPRLVAVMTEQEYDHVRADLGARKDAGARWDQQLAALFIRSGWTQERLAEKEGKTQQWVAYRLRFGRFLTFTTTVVNADSQPKNLTEGRFRNYWSRTEGNERQRFIAVQKLIADDLALHAKKRPQIGKQIVEKFGDGKWYPLKIMAKALDVEEDHLFATLKQMRWSETYGAKCERKQVGNSHSYRIFRKEKQISSQELIEKLGPIIEGLKIEGKKNATTASPPTVAHLAGKLQQLLDEWTK